MKRKNNKNKDDKFEYEDQYTEDDADYEYEDDDENDVDENDVDYEYYDDDEEDEAPRPEKTLKVVFGIVIAAFVILGILVGVFFLVKNKSKDDETTAPVEETEEINEVINPEDKYPLGKYEVKIQSNGSLNLRKDHSRESDSVKSVGNGTILEITEVVIEENAKEHSTEYWGKTEYDGNVLWVMMNFLVRYYGEDESAEDKEPSEDKTTEEKTTDEKTTEEKTTAEKTTEEKTTEETTTKKDTSSGDAPSAGTYTVNADEYIRLRSNHSVNSDSILNIDKGEKLTITEIYHNEDGDKYTSYWGKTTFGGKTGWVAMGYLN